MAFFLRWFGILFACWVCTCCVLHQLCRYGWLPRKCALCRFHRRAS